MEYYIEANSFAAPFFSDTSHGYVEASSPTAALEKFAGDYSHPCGLFAAVAYSSADAKNKGEIPLARWLCNHQLEKLRLTEGLDCYSYTGHGPGDFEIGGVRHKVNDPKSGRVV